MADIAILVHWPPSEMAAMELDEFIGWHQRLVARHNHLHGCLLITTFRDQETMPTRSLQGWFAT